MRRNAGREQPKLWRQRRQRRRGRDGHDGKKLLGYLDGALVQDVTDTIGGVAFADNLSFGGRPGVSAEFFKGLLDEFAIWKRALTDAELADLRVTGQCTP
ncbi:MAG: LamG domain-containing protein [Myxococcales bacterium]|nr:LamG domain-containing protein [Myxococcales bacterium]